MSAAPFYFALGMANIDDINEAIAENATGPKRVSVAGEEVESRSIDELIKGAEYVAGQTAATNPNFGLRFTKLVSPGCGG